MKKIINGKMYNTETAKAVGTYDNGCYRNDYRFWSDTLYTKNNGQFFLYCEGGPMTRYGKENGDGSFGFGEMIVPITVEEAKRWSQKNLDADSYIEIFGDVEE